jgi:hypothetical protein
MESVHPSGKGDGVSVVPPGWCSVPGTVRTEIRTRAYQGQTYRTYALHSETISCDMVLGNR